jgi:hypothetical protein
MILIAGVGLGLLVAFSYRKLKWTKKKKHI